MNEFIHTKDYYKYFIFYFIPKVIGHDCDILEAAKARYLQIIGKQASHTYRGYRKNNATEFKFKPRNIKSWREDSNFKEYLDVVDLNLKSPCDSMPHLDMDESCKLFLLFFKMHAVLL